MTRKSALALIVAGIFISAALWHDRSAAGNVTFVEPGIAGIPTPTPTPEPTCTPAYGISDGFRFITFATGDTGNHCDDCTSTINLAFFFRFYGQQFSHITVDSNGRAFFQGGTAVASNTCLPHAADAYAIYPYWDDLRTDTLGACSQYSNGQCGVFWDVSGITGNRTVFIEWRAVYAANPAMLAHFEIILYEALDRFEVIYDVAQGNTSATAGVQRDESNFTSYFCNGNGGPASGDHVYTLACGVPTPTPTPTPSPTPTVFPTPSPCYAGMLDPTFAGNGTEIINIGGGDYALDVALQSDGKIVATGNSWNDGYPDIAVARLNPDGTLDNSFGIGGRLITQVGPGFNVSESVVIQPDDRIVVAGASIIGRYYDFTLVRYQPNGALDTSFGTDGKVTTPIGTSNDGAHSVALQPDGKIIAVGYTTVYSSGVTNDDFALVRYNVDGTLDSTFGADGKVRTPIGNIDDDIFAVAVQPDGRIVAAGSAVMGTSDFAVVCYNSDGTLDSAFGSGGKVTTRISNNSYDSVQAVAIQSDGKIVVAGYSGIFPLYDFAVARYNVNGTLDNSFGIGGKVTTSIASGADYGESIAIQPDGRIVVGGYTPAGFALVRYNSDGTLDSSFGIGGIVITTIAVNSYTNAVAIQSDGRILAVGPTNAGSTGYDFAFARYLGTALCPTPAPSPSGTPTPLFTPTPVPTPPHTPITPMPTPTPTEFPPRPIYFETGETLSSPEGRTITIVVRGYSYVFGVGAEVLSTDGTAVGGSSCTSGVDYIRVNRNVVIPPFYQDRTTFDVTLCPNDIAEPVEEFQLELRNPSTGAYLGTPNRVFISIQSAQTPFDYDGDRVADISVYRPSQGVWNLQRSRDGFVVVPFGLSTDKITPADFDGDTRADVAVYRPTTGTWYWLNSSNGAFYAAQFGVADDLPTPADYDGDGRADISVFRASSGTWYRLDSSNGSFYAAQFGVSEDKPTVGDFDGDGLADIAVWRPSNGAWYRLNSSNGQFVAVGFGLSTDLITPADFDGDGKTDVAVYRPSSGVWYWLNSSNGAFNAAQFGVSEDIPSAADYDGDGTADICVFRPSSGIWYRLNSSNGAFVAVQFGINGDRPTPAAFRY